MSVMIDNAGIEGLVQAEVFEGYQDGLVPRISVSETPAPEGAEALPAWIKSQVEQLEMRRKARHLSAMHEMKKDDSFAESD
jgi:hypothetical protein